MHGGNLEDPVYLPVGLAFGSQTNLVFATHEILKTVGFDISRVLTPHEPGMTKLYPNRTTKNGHYLIEVALAEGQQSYV
ncbi:hypothetical protein D3C80_1779900 [compost metagenome]